MCAILAAGLWGCATIDDLSQEAFRAPAFGPEQLRGQTVGVLPVFARGSRRSYLDSANHVFRDSLKSEWHTASTIASEEVLRRIADGGAQAEYLATEQRYASGLVPEETPLRRIATAVGARYLLLTELTDVELAEGATQVRLAGRLWDADGGRIVWEGSGTGRGYVFLIFPWAPSSFEKTMAVASRGLLRNVQ